MTMQRAELSPDLVFDDAGHLSEVALSCIADGEQELIGRLALDHLDGCDQCAHRLGEAALLSINVGDEMLAAREQLAVQPVVESPIVAPEPRIASPVPSRPRRPMPVAAIAAALLVAVVTAGPTLIDLFQSLPSTVAGLMSTAPFLLRMLLTVAHTAPSGLGSAAPLLQCASALVFVVLGLRVARAARRARSLQQGGS